MAPNLCLHVSEDGSPMRSPGSRSLNSPLSVGGNKADMVETGQRSPSKKHPEFANLLDSSVGLKQALAHEESRHAFRASTSPTKPTRASQSPLIESLDSPLKPLEPRSLLGDAPSKPGAIRLNSPSNLGEERARLRGDGEAIGYRGRASLGIPWRQIPVHDTSGQLRTTGDPSQASPESRTCETVVGQSRKVSAFSPKLGGGKGMREILTPGEKLQAEGTTVSCTEKLEDAPVRNLFPPDGNEEPIRHFNFKAQKKGVSQDCSTKDTCPFFRADSAADQQGSQNPTKASRILDGNLQGSGASPKGGCNNPTSVEYPLAEKSVEARRDWKALHQNPQLERMAAEVPILRNQLRALSPRQDGPAVGGFRGSRASIGGQQKRWK